MKSLHTSLCVPLGPQQIHSLVHQHRMVQLSVPPFATVTNMPLNSLEAGGAGRI